MSFDPISALTTGLLPGLFGSKQQAPPIINIPASPPIEMPTPDAPPKAPLTPSQTAALQRARQRGATAGGGTTSLILNAGGRGGSRDDGSGAVTRATLLGR